jgi:hypothetical protein
LHAQIPTSPRKRGEVTRPPISDAIALAPSAFPQ